MCISQGWPSQLVTLLSLKLPALAAYCPVRFHGMLRSLQPDLVLHGLDVPPSTVPSEGVYLVSGSGSFISRFLPSPQHRAWAITHVEMRFRDHPGHSKGKVARSLGNSVLGPLGLCPVFFHHAGFGGATDGIYAIGLGGSADPAEHVRRAPLPPLRRSLRHFWTPSLSPRDIVVCEPPPPTRSGRDWHGHCLLHEGAARMEGLFPVSDSSITCIGPSVFHPNKSVRRCLSPDEMLRLFDVPMAVDSSLSTTRWNLARGPAPFEEALPATIWAWILRTIWGNDGGVSSISLGSVTHSLGPTSPDSTNSAPSNDTASSPPSPPIASPTAAPPLVPSTDSPIAPPTTAPLSTLVLPSSLAPAPSSHNPAWFHEDVIPPLTAREYESDDELSVDEDAIPPLTVRER